MRTWSWGAGRGYGALGAWVIVHPHVLYVGFKPLGLYLERSFGRWRLWRAAK